MEPVQIIIASHPHAGRADAKVIHGIHDNSNPICLTLFRQPTRLALLQRWKNLRRHNCDDRNHH
jgi:hypothetical protein